MIRLGFDREFGSSLRRGIALALATALSIVLNQSSANAQGGGGGTIGNGATSGVSVDADGVLDAHDRAGSER